MQQKSLGVLGLSVLVSVPGFLAGQMMRVGELSSASGLTLIAAMVALIAATLVTQRSS